MELEQIKLENEKLKGRLNKAVEVFKEQKSHIESLEKENAQLKVKCDESINNYNKLYSDFENISADLQAAEQCNERAHKQLIVAEEKLNQYDIECKSLQTTNDDLNKQIDNYELRIKEAESKFKESEQIIQDIQKSNNETEEQFNKILCSYEIENKQQKDEITALNTRLGEVEQEYDKLLHNTDNEISGLNEKLNNQDLAYEELRKKYNETTELAKAEKQEFVDAISNFIQSVSKLMFVETIHTDPTKYKTTNNFVSEATEFNM